MGLKECSCGAKYSGGFLDTQCPACVRQGRLEESMEQQAAAAQEQAAAAMYAAAAQAAAAEREAAAKEALMAKQGEAAIANSVGKLSVAELERLDQYEKNKEDRLNIQRIIDEVGNCVACVEQSGRPTEHFPLHGGAGDYGVANDGDAKWPAAARYENLNRALAKLIDLREEVGAVRNWDANSSRETVLGRIETKMSEAKSHRAQAAARTVAEVKTHKRKYGRNFILLLSLGAAAALFASGKGLLSAVGLMIAFFAFLSAFIVAIGIFSTPRNWERIQEFLEDA